jgi:hypothetical protein
MLTIFRFVEATKDQRQGAKEQLEVILGVVLAEVGEFPGLHQH